MSCGLISGSNVFCAACANMSVLMNQIIRAIATPYKVEEILDDVKRVTSFCADCGTIE